MRGRCSATFPHQSSSSFSGLQREVCLSPFPTVTLISWLPRAGLGTIRSLGTYPCPRCMVMLNEVPDIGKNCDHSRRHPLRDYANDTTGRVEAARTLIFDKGMSVGGELDILKRGSIIPTRVTLIFCHPHTQTHVSQSAYYTELGLNPAGLMPVDPLHDWDIGIGKNVTAHNIRILHAIGRSAVNLFDAQCVPKHIYWVSVSNPQLKTPCCTGSAKFPPSVVVPSESLEGVFRP